MRLLLFGPPGAGKGTQCNRLVKKYGVLHLSSGDILRAEQMAGTELGKKVQSYMDSGGLVPDDLIVAIMAGAIKKAGNSGFVLDGFPRTVVQAQILDAEMAKAGKKIRALLNLQIDDAVAASRMSGRRSCPKCGDMYHIEHRKPKVDNVCDNDGTVLIQRKDDRSEVVANRLKTYHEQTARVMDYYEGKKLVISIDAGREIEEVTKDIFAKLDAFKIR
ncbi:MAG: adenylate kinase [Sedimentisphaerales bacterium]|nr:adenylate kinase [Sedimentisphaerales bacterium]